MWGIAVFEFLVLYTGIVGLIKFITGNWHVGTTSTIGLAAIAVIGLKAQIWGARAGEGKTARRWRARMIREAEERLARDDPERDW